MAKAPPTLDQITGDLRRRMDGALETLKKEFAGLRTGRASPALLEPIRVEVYGTEMPITQVGTIGVPEPRMLTVQVWDRAAVPAVEKAIRDSGLGLNPASDGQTVRVPLPPLTAERRVELAKLAGKYAEAARVAIRAVRRDGMETLKKLEKDHEIGQDVHRDWAEEVQKLTDAYIRKVDEALAAKEADIRQP
ncbi:ribosome recycling factor [Elioraea sp. Yellowstone]|jgi:ribosome recycling factor|uniref:ribosome recycling factor n=1 Tax=Elioraea sp. Yellowstone TaxID=2592070 RepID=UPI001153AC12|nr:ribosome recycling factor [Elioraea sp. Yellowstone]TQF79417.1 ribosome recycling factor [Elioraea sp. Yellowstone]